LVGELYILWCKLAGDISWPTFLILTVVAVLASYSCLSLSVDRLLYSYQVALRQAVILLLRQRNAPTEKKPEARTAHNPSAPPDVNHAARSHRQ
jgi:predicted RecB family endonuclease